MNKVTSNAKTGLESVESGRIATSMFCIILGSFLFFGAGFGPMTSLHNATHDTRHAFSMPCH